MEAVAPRELAGTPLFRGLSFDQFGMLGEVSSRRVYRPGDFILREGEPDQFVYVLVEGRAQVVKRASDTDHALPLREVTVGDVLGEMKMLDRKPSSASVVATTAVEALAIDLDAFEQNPSLADARTLLLYNLGNILADRLRHTNSLGADALKRELDESRARAQAGRFAFYMFAMLGGYQLAVAALWLVPEHRPPDSVLAFGIILAGCVPVVLSLWRSPFPL